MCLIFHKTLVDDVQLEFLTDVWKKNPDGWGILYNDPDTQEVIALKGLIFSDYLVEHYRLEEDNIEFISHFRYATHGKVTRKNCHPFKVMNGMYLMHNGVFDIAMGKDSKLSDTRIFVRDVLRPLLDSVKDPFAFIQTYAFQNMMDFYCEGQDSRLVLYTKDGPQFYGTWADTTKGMLVSNHYAFTVDNPSNKSLSSHRYDDFDWDAYEKSYQNRTSNSTTMGFIKNTEPMNLPYSTSFYPETDLDTRFQDAVDEDERYVKSLSDGLDNFEIIAETYWDLTDSEIDFVADKIAMGEWCFEMDGYNPHESILWDETGAIVRKDNLPSYIHLSKVEKVA